MQLVLIKSLDSTAEWEPKGGNFLKEGTAKRVYGSQTKPSAGKVWHVKPFDNPDRARAAHAINKLAQFAGIKSPDSKIVRHGDKLAVARRPVPKTHKEVPLDEKLRENPHFAQTAAFNALVGARPENFKYFAGGKDQPLHQTSQGVGLHIGEDGPGKPFQDERDMAQIINHPEAKTNPDIREGVKRLLKMTDAQISHAVGGAGFEPQEADALGYQLQRRQQMLKDALARGDFGGTSKENAQHLRQVNATNPWAGAPPSIKNLKTPAARKRAFETLKDKLRETIRAGWEGRNWYKESAEKFKAVAGGDMSEVQKIAALHAIFSPQREPISNTESAIRAYLHYKAGKPRDQLVGGHTPAQEEKARALLYDNHWHEGIKTNSFYRNLMTELSGQADRAPEPGEQQPTTNDIWVGRGFGYPQVMQDRRASGFTAPQHVFMTRVQNDMAREFGISAHRAQAALWVALKGQDLGSFERGAESYKHGIESAQGHIVSSLTPHPESGMLPGFEKLPSSAQHELHRGVLEALHDESGRFLPTHIAGFGSEPAEEIGPHGLMKFKALTARNLGPTTTQEKLVTDLEGKLAQKGLDPAYRTRLKNQLDTAMADRERKEKSRKFIQGPIIHQVRGIASLVAHLTGQKDIDIQRPMHKIAANAAESNGAHIRTKVPLTQPELAKFAKAIKRRLGSGASDEPVTPIPYEHGAYVINRHGVPNEKFHEAVKRGAMETLGLVPEKDKNNPSGNLFGGTEDKSRPDAEFDRFFAHATRASNNYKEAPNGETHRQRADAALGPTLSRRILSELAPRLRGVYEAFAKKHKLKLKLPEGYRIAQAQAPGEALGETKAASFASGLVEPLLVLSKSEKDKNRVWDARVSNGRNPYFAVKAVRHKGQLYLGTGHWNQHHQHIDAEVKDHLSGRRKMSPKRILPASNHKDAEFEHGLMGHDGRFYKNDELDSPTRETAQAKKRKYPSTLEMFRSWGRATRDVVTVLFKSRVKYLYHGTTEDNVASIQQHGLEGRLSSHDDWSGNFVTTDPKHAYAMGQDMRKRHRGRGKTVVLQIDRNHPSIRGAKLDLGTGGGMEHGHELSHIMKHPKDYHSFRLPHVHPDAIIGVLHRKDIEKSKAGYNDETWCTCGLRKGEHKDKKGHWRLRHTFKPVPQGYRPAERREPPDFERMDAMMDKSKAGYNDSIMSAIEPEPAEPKAPTTVLRKQKFKQTGGGLRADVHNGDRTQNYLQEKHLSSIMTEKSEGGSGEFTNVASVRKSPYYRNYAIKNVRTGEVHEAQAGEYWHRDIEARVNRAARTESNKMPRGHFEHGMVGHEGAYYHRNTMDQLADEHREVHGYPAHGTKVVFSNQQPKPRAPLSKFSSLRLFRSKATTSRVPLPTLVLAKAASREDAIRQVHALRNTSGRTPAEAETAHRLVGNLMTRHGIAEHEVTGEAKPKDPWGELRRKPSSSGMDRWAKEAEAYRAQRRAHRNYHESHPTSSCPNEDCPRNPKDEDLDDIIKRVKPVEKSAVLKSAHKLHYRTTFAGLPISIENRKGSYRYWKNHDNGTEGKTLMKYPYGYIRRTEGEDEDKVDCFLGPNENAPNVYVVRQTKAPDFERYDEDKVMLGFDSAGAAYHAYKEHYNDPRFFGTMDTYPLGEFRAKVFLTKDHPGPVPEPTAKSFILGGRFYISKGQGQGGGSMGKYAKAPALRIGTGPHDAKLHTGKAGEQHFQVLEKVPEHEQDKPYIESGFIGHDDHYYSRHHIHHLIAAAENRHPGEVMRPDSIRLHSSHEPVVFTAEHHTRANHTMETERKEHEYRSRLMAEAVAKTKRYD